MGKRKGEITCPLCGKIVYGLMKDEIGNKMCKDCFKEIYVHASKPSSGYNYEVRGPEIQDMK